MSKNVNSEKRKVSVPTIIRTIVMVVTLVNSVLTMIGKNPLPFSEEQIYIFLSAAVSVGVTIWTWWKNNSFTQAALAADEMMQKIQEGVDEEVTIEV